MRQRHCFVCQERAINEEVFDYCSTKALHKIDLAIEEKSQIKKKHGVYCTYYEKC